MLGDAGHHIHGGHFKGRFGGQLLSATRRDGNNNIFPVALAVVEQVCKESWIWFLKHFVDDIGKPEDLNLVFRYEFKFSFFFFFIIIIIELSFVVICFGYWFHYIVCT